MENKRRPRSYGGQPLRHGGRATSPSTADGGPGVTIPILIINEILILIIIHKAIKKLKKDIDETQLFLANESNRVDEELEQVRTTGHDLHARLCEVEDTTVTDQYVDHQVQLINQRLDDYHDELHDQATAIYNQKNIMNGILAGHRLQRAEPSSVWAISAIQTIDQMAAQMNRQTDLINRLQARVDVLEFRQLPRPGAIIDSDNNNSDNNNIVTQCQY